METIQDRLQVEAQDYQELSAAAYKRAMRRRTLAGPFHKDVQWAQASAAELSRIARSALFELIGAAPEIAERSS